METKYVQGEAFFRQINKVPRQFEYLTEDIDTDVIIIGGGVTGSILGYYFSKENINTVILEKKRIAHGSTSITTALLQYELDSNAAELQNIIDINDVIKSYKMGLRALGKIEEFIKKYGNNCDYERKDTLLFTEKDNEKEELYQEFILRKDNGLNVEFITEENNPFSFNLKAGVYSIEGGAQLDPYKFTQNLLEIALEKGIKVYENTEALKINYYDDFVEVITSYGYVVKGKRVIIATGYNIENFTGENFGVKTITYNIATKPIKKFNGWKNRVLIRDNNDPYNYLRTTKDNRIIIGGEDVDLIDGINDEDIAKSKYSILEKRVKDMFPDIEGVEVDYKYCGVFESTKDNLGVIGKDSVENRKWFCLGYGANGILFAILGGIFLVDLYKGKEDSNLKLFKLDRFNLK